MESTITRFVSGDPEQTYYVKLHPVHIENVFPLYFEKYIEEKFWDQSAYQWKAFKRYKEHVFFDLGSDFERVLAQVNIRTAAQLAAAWR